MPRTPHLFDRRAFVRGAGGLVGAASVAAWTPVRAGATGVDPRIERLARALDGEVLTRSSPGYGAARLGYNERFDDVYPRVIALPGSIGDVVTVVRWARDSGMPLAIRSGGHSYAGYSTGTGLVVDLRRLAGVAFDRRTGVVTAGPAARMIDVEAALAPYGRAVPSGSCATVGIGGLAQGGGVGLASRAFGTTSDNVVSFGIVTADGRYRVCDATHDEDLFWACRGGGGGNFGIVTHLALRTHPVSSVSYFFADWPWAQAGAVVEAWQSFASHAPDELFSICSLGTGAAEPTVGVFGQYLGAEAELGRILAPLTGVAGLALTTGASSYLSAQLRWAGCLGKTVAQCHIAGETPAGTLGRALFTGKSDYLTDRLSTTGRATIVDQLERAQGGGFGSGALLLDSYGGALNRPAAAATAFVHRSALGSAQYLAYWGVDAEQAAALDWIRGFYAAMRPFVSGYAYQNYIDRDLARWSHAYYGSNYPRLQAIKKDVDPHELFHFAQSIRPA